MTGIQERSAMPSGEHLVYPISLTNMAGVRAVVVGGGQVAERKVAGLVAVGASVHVISPELTPALHESVCLEHIEWTGRPYQEGDLAGAFIVVAATDMRLVNAQVAQEAAQWRILCNVVDAPEEGSFHVPAVSRQDGVTVAVSSGGADPRRSVRIRDRIRACLWVTNHSGEL